MDAWDRFCDDLKAAGSLILDPANPQDELVRVEGFRYLSRLTKLALEKMVESGDVEFPTLYQLSHPTAKIGFDNPDSHYLNAELDGALEYRLTGRLGTAHYLGMGTYYGAYGHPGPSGLAGYLDVSELAVAADGTVDIAIGGPERAGNWLPLHAGPGMLIIRENRNDHDAERLSEWQLTCTSPTKPDEPTPLTAERLAQGFEHAAAYVAGTVSLFAERCQWLRDTAPNTFMDMRPKQSGGHVDPNIVYLGCAWELGPDEALVVDLDVPDCRYWNIQVCNWWQESMDYRFAPAHLNEASAVRGEDGHVRVVLSHEDLGRPNRLTTGTHPIGTLCVRWLGADRCPIPTAQVVRAADLRS